VDGQRAGPRLSRPQGWRRQPAARSPRT
jgi:hypothetical protein